MLRGLLNAESANFWKLVEQYCPEYRKMRGWLKRNGMALG